MHCKWELAKYRYGFKTKTAAKVKKTRAAAIAYAIGI